MTRRFAFAYSKANRTIRRVPATEMGFTVTPASGRISKLGQFPQLLPERFGLRRPRRELDPLVEVLRVLPDHDEVHRPVSRRHAGERSRGAHGGEQVQLLAKRHVDAAEPGSHRRGDRSLDGDPRSPGSNPASPREGGRRARRGPRRPPARWIHSIPGTAASRTSRAADDTSGPMPSPGISVTRCRPTTSAPYSTLWTRRVRQVTRADPSRGQRRVSIGRSSSNQTHAPCAPETSPHRSAILLRRWGSSPSMRAGAVSGGPPGRPPTRHP